MDMPMAVPTIEARNAHGRYMLPWAAKSPASGITISLGTGSVALSRAMSAMTDQYPYCAMNDCITAVDPAIAPLMEENSPEDEARRAITASKQPLYMLVWEDTFKAVAMKLLKFRENEGTLALKPETMEDLWSMARVVFPGDSVKARSLRKFKSSESDEGELKEVTVSIAVERLELDKTAQRLRFTGKITGGHPLAFIRMGSYHTINTALGDIVEISKGRWPSYVMEVVRTAVSDTRRPRLGIIAMDDEKAQPALLLGYGIDFKQEIYSRLSKRMSQKDFQEHQRKYFDSVAASIASMDVSTVIVAGPGFTKDDLKRHMDDSGTSRKLAKQLVFLQVSNAERSGVYELIRSEAVEGVLKGEHIRKEFLLMERFLKGLASKASRYGPENVGKALDDYEADTVLVNDSVLPEPAIQELLSRAEKGRVRVAVFGSEDEVGQQLHSFRDIACVS